MVTYVPDSVQANFTYSPLLGYKGEPIQFSDLSGNTIVNDPCTYEWDWGDRSANGHTKNATHTYWNAGNYTVMLWVTGSKNLARSLKVLTVPVGEHQVIPETCNPAGGNTDGIVDMNASTYERFTPAGACVQPYQCMCAPGSYAKYQCTPGFGAILIMVNHPDCCKFCGVDTSAPGDTPTVLPPAPVFEIVDITVSPSTCNIGDIVTAIAHVKNTGNAAGAATVTFYWDNGRALDLSRTTDVIYVNMTVPTPPAMGQAPAEGMLKICAVVR